jgi:membrane protease YdiL (CAAX protease family)
MEFAPSSSADFVRAIAVALGVLGLGVCVWVFWPAFRGIYYARREIGTHRLAIGAVIVVLVLNAAITLPLAQLGYLRVDRGFTTATFVLAALSTEIPMLLFIYLRLILPGAVTWRELGLVPLRLDYVLRMGVAGGLVGLIGVDVIGTLLSQAGLRPNQLEQFSFVLSEGPASFALLLFAAGFLAPCVEELFFRGFLFGLYRERHSTWVAYLASGILFTLLHLEPTRMNLAQMAGLSVGIFLLATVLAWLYQRTGSLYPSMLAHAINNATGLILFYAVGVR